MYIVNGVNTNLIY